MAGSPVVLFSVAASPILGAALVIGTRVPNESQTQAVPGCLQPRDRTSHADSALGGLTAGDGACGWLQWVGEEGRSS